MSILYRLRQFWHTISASTDPHDLDKALELLNPDQAALFLQLQMGEQNHATEMVRKLRMNGQHHPDLLVAALLHDVGKLRYRLNPIERTVIVLVKMFIPQLAHQWGRLSQGGWETSPRWRRSFILAEQHADWGAELARGAGVSRLTETLILRHEQPHWDDLNDMENHLLNKLWIVDNES